MLLSPKLTLNRLFLRIISLGTVALIVMGALLAHHEQQKAAKQWQSDVISKSASLTSSYYSMLNTRLLLGHGEEVARMLQGLRKEENLVSASIVAPEKLSRSALETCNIDYTHAYFLQVPTCYETTNGTLKVYHELRSIGYSIGYLLKEIKIPILSFCFTTSMAWHIGCVLFVFLSVMVLVLLYIKKHLIKPLNNIGESLKAHKFLPDNEMHLKVDELQVIFESLKHSVLSITEYERKIQKYEYDAKMGNMATQVAHDIRSPLSSLKAAAEMLGGHVAGNDEALDALNLLQLSSQRLEGIADGLLAKHKGLDSGPQVFSIHEVLDELVGEFQASPLGNGTEFKKQYHTDALYISGDRIGINRAIGNIIKNALEAMGQNGANKPRQLIVSTALGLPPHPSPLPEGEGVKICITDTGPGISADKIPLILRGGHTDGKDGGHGIGTKVVKDVVETHQGQITIDSQMGVGTTFIITLPLTVPIDGAETGMTVSIPYSGMGPIHVIDDEPSMREQWRLTLKTLGISAETYTCWEDYSQKMSDTSGAPTPEDCRTLSGTYIVDYHFDNSVVDGVEIIRRLKVRGFRNLVLATAEYWKPAIKAASREFKITLCPKPLPKVVLSPPVQQQQPSQCHPDTTGPSILLIDDDSSIHFSWKMMRKSLGVGNLTMHSNLEEMIAAATNPAKFDLCVIDKNIEGSQFDGARTLEYLRQNGARTIVLASGETGDDIRNDPRFNAADGVLKSKVPMTPEELDPFLN